MVLGIDQVIEILLWLVKHSLPDVIGLPGGGGLYVHVCLFASRYNSGVSGLNSIKYSKLSWIIISSKIMDSGNVHILFGFVICNIICSFQYYLW